MKKFFISAVSFIMVLVTLVPTSFAANDTLPEWQDLVLTESEFEAILANGTVYTADENARASDLISRYGLSISKSSTNVLNIVGKTTGTYEVVETGFKELVIQRRANSSAEWTDYLSYEYLYTNGTSYTLSKKVTVPTGYQYRVTCVHYAKKNIFSVQKLDNVSNTVQF